MNKGNRDFLMRIVAKVITDILIDDFLIKENGVIFCIKKNKEFKIIDIIKDNCKGCNHYNYHWN